MKAKENLSKFDFVLITEEFRNQIYINVFGTMLNSEDIVKSSIGEMVNKGSSKNSEKLKSTLAPDIESVVAELKQLNRFDLELYEFAKELSKQRFDNFQKNSAEPYPLPESCSNKRELAASMSKVGRWLGLDRPVGHKGPI